ncbi:MAG: hypothetical protein KGL43_11250 [Burkholderiales bacterium]|nr:hypothetical protein [Burkholderiales bacterium]MDE2454158.1 hypothetical protein [Burkholderiales bacterium]
MVLLLFVVISLVAAYTSRSMIFEQQTSANYSRSSVALEAAEAGIGWAVGMLNTAQAVDTACVPNATGTPFRTSYLVLDPKSATPVAPTPWISAFGNGLTCVRTGDGAWTCSCPVGAAATPSVPAVAANAVQGSFAVQFGSPNPNGSMLLTSTACTTADYNCLLQSTWKSGQAVAQVQATVALKGAISAPPPAALTSGGAVSVTNMRVSSLSNLVAIDSAGASSTNPTWVGLPPGTPLPPPNSGVVQSDTSLPPTADMLFTSVFGTSRNTYQWLPSTVFLQCPAQCDAATLSSTAAANPGRALWLSGNADLASAVTIGSPTGPVVIIATGNITTSAAVRIYGLVYAATLTANSTPLIQGAAVVEGDVTGSGTPTIVYDLGLLTWLRLAAGTFAVVPGSWSLK